MAKYRKKPVVIDAVRITAADFIAPDGWPDGSPFDEAPAPTWLVDAIVDKRIVPVGKDLDYALWEIHTLEGVMTAGPDDYIIRGVEGEVYFCKPNIFNKTYEKIE